MKKFISYSLLIFFIFCFSGCLDIETPSLTQTPTQNSTSITTEKSTSQTSTPSAKPTKSTSPPIKTAKPTAEPTATANTPAKTPSEVLVWIPTNGGTKYHSKSTCSNMKNPTQVTKSTAISKGFSACGRCY